MPSIAKLYNDALALSTEADINVLKLGGVLLKILEHDPYLLEKLIDEAGLGTRKAYFVISIAASFHGFEVEPKRLSKLGWGKLSIIAPHVHKDNAEELIELAEGATMPRLRVLMSRIYPPKNSVFMLMGFSRQDFEVVANALVKFGAVRNRRLGILNKEEALLNLIRKSAAK